METGDIGSTEGDSAVMRSVPDLQTTNPDKTWRWIQIAAVLLCYLPFAVGLVRMLFRYFDTVNPTEWLSDLLVPAAGYVFILIVSVSAVVTQSMRLYSRAPEKSISRMVRSSCYKGYANLYLVPFVVWHLVYVLTRITDGTDDMSILISSIPILGAKLSLYFAISELTHLLVIWKPASNPLKLTALILIAVTGCYPFVVWLLWLGVQDYLSQWHILAKVFLSYIIPLGAAWWMYRATEAANYENYPQSAS